MGIGADLDRIYWEIRSILGNLGMGIMGVVRLGPDRVRVTLRGQRRAKRQRALAIRRRWYAGGVATLLSFALVATGAPAALADGAEDLEPQATQSLVVEEPAVEDPAPTPDQPEEPKKEEPKVEGPAPTEEPKKEEPQKSDEESSGLGEGDDELLAEGDAGIGIMSIPNPDPVPSGQTTLRIKKLGDRNANGSVSTLSGATFVAFPSTRGGNRTGSTSLTCTTDATGHCDIIVPARTGGSGGSTQGYWVYETSAPSGYHVPGNLGLGNYDSGKTSTPYSYFTNNVSGTGTIWLVTEDATAYVGSGSNPSSTTKSSQNGFANVRNNAPFPQWCGLSIAIVFDKSSSINSSEMTSMRNAALGFVGTNGLGGTPSSVSLYQFNTTAARFLTTTSIAGSQTTVNNAINNNISGSGSGYTNWDDAMRKVAFNGTETYDVVLFLTDGDPTVNGTSGSNQETTIGFRNIEEGIFSANTVKNMTGPSGHRTKVVAVGIGLANNSHLNLAAISGPNSGSDYYTTNFEGLAQQLRAIAQQNCGGTLTVVKKTIDADGTVISNNAGGWTFTGSTSGAWIKREGQSNVSSLALTTPSSGPSQGAVNFPIDLTGVPSRVVNVKETIDTTQWTAESVICTGGSSTGSAADFNVTVGVNAIVSCTVTNRKLPPTQLTITKAFQNQYGAPAVPGDWTLTATNGGNTTNFVSGVTQTVAPGTYTIGEVLKDGYELVGVTCTGDTGVTYDPGTQNVTIPVNTSASCIVTNKDKPASLIVKKYSTLNPNATIPGATFSLWSDVNGNGTLEPGTDTIVQVGGSNTFTAGEQTISGLSWGKYLVQEVTPPTGYSLSVPAVQAVELGGVTLTHTVSFHNAPSYTDLTVTKTAEESFSRDYDWSIEKIAIDPSKNARPGVATSFEYQITVTPSGPVDSDFAVRGEIAVHNPNNVTMPATVSDAIVGATCTVQSPSRDIPANTTVYFDYECEMPAGTTATSSGTNTATATWVAANFPGTTGSASSSAVPWSFVGVNPTVTDGSVVVSDTAPEFAATYTAGERTVQATGGPKVFTYTRDLTVTDPGTCEEFENEASIAAGSQGTLKDDATVELCTGANLTVSKNVVTSLTRTYDWDLEKSVDETVRTVDENGEATFTYTVEATPGDFNDSLWAMSGKITVTNPNAWAVEVDVTDVPSFGGSCVVTDGTDAEIAANSSEEFDYTCTFTNPPASLTGTNTATITWDPNEAFSTGSTANNVVQITEDDWIKSFVNNVVTLIDDKTDPANPVTLGQATWNAERTPTSFTYDVTFEGTPGECVDFTNKTWLDELQNVKDEQEVTVCAYTGLTVTKTANTSFTRTYPFDIDKEAAQTQLTVDPLTGEATAAYTVTVTDGQPADTGFAVTGLITVTNPNSVPVTLTSVTDVIGDTSCAATLPATPVVPAGGGTLGIPYTCALTGMTASSTGTNTATVTWDSSNLPGSSGTASGNQGFDFAAATITDVNKTVTVVDDKTNPAATPHPVLGTRTWTAFEASQSYSYELVLTANAGTCVEYDNTARIVETQQSAGETVTVCAPTGEIDKDVLGVSANSDGTWTVTYGLAVRNPSTTGVAFEYSLRDVFDFGDGFTVVPGTPTVLSTPAGVTPRADWDGDAQPVIVDSATLPANAGGTATHSYQIQVGVSFDDETAKPGLTCVEVEPGAFRNIGQITAVGSSRPLDQDDACAEPATPTFTKTADSVTATPNAAGNWDVSYTLTVTNPTYGTPDPQALYYELRDVAGASITGGVSLVGGGWSVTASGTIVANPSWNGITDTTITAGQLIGADEQTHVYTVTGEIAVAPTVPAEQLTCDPQEASNSGIVNTATLTHPFGEIDGRACVSIEPPELDIDKTVTSTQQLANGNWQIRYEVEVSNTSGLIASYNLVDELQFGGDITVVSGTWSLESTLIEGVFSGTTATLAAGRQIAVDATHTYIVLIEASLDEGAWAGDTLTCDESGKPDAGGFLNTATVTAGGTSKTADDCSEPASPEVAKTGTSVTQDPTDPDSWIVTYEVTVQAPDASDTYYTLEDIPGFASGVTLGDGTAQIEGGSPVAITSGGTFPAAPVLLEAGDTHRWTVSWHATIAGGIAPPEAAQCGQEIQPGKGFYNLIELFQAGALVDDDDACMDIVERVYPTLKKTATSVTQNAGTGQWTIVYEVEATLAPEGPQNPANLSARYVLVDTLDFGGDITVSSAMWTGPASSGGTFSGDSATMTPPGGRTITPGATHTYTVTVIADVAATAIEEGTTICDGGEVPGAGGFLNTVTLTSGGQAIDRDACAEPVFPEIEKSAAETVDNGDGSFDISYLVTVTHPATDADPAPVVRYTLTDEPTLPAGVELDGDWTVTPVGDETPAPDAATWDGSGTWTIVEDAVLSAADNGDGTHSYLIAASVQVTAPPVGEPEICRELEEWGIVIPNVATLTSGAYEADDDACQVVHYDDVSLLKTSELPEGQTSVEPGDTFDYVLTVTNHGTRPAEDVRVIDDSINDRLEILSVTVEGYTFDGDGFTGNEVDLTLNETIPVDGTAVVRVTVQFLPAPTPDLVVVPEGETPEFADPLEVLTNTACVQASRDADPLNNCDDEDIPTRDLTGTVFAICVNDAPLLGWAVKKSELLRDEPISFLWTPDGAVPTTDPANVSLTSPVGELEWSDLIQWPGTAFTPSGVSVDYPGWRALQASDLAPGGGFYFPGTTTVMTSEEEANNIFNGLILDDSELDYAWRGATTVTFTVNPELAFSASYPEATPDCRAARHTELEITKTASVEKAERGGSFTYTIAVENVSDDAAADGVVVTDPIPGDIRITDVTWPGKDDASVFPNWETCAVTGQNAAGYGGTLRCELHGPLQPAGAPAGGASAAPTITLAATVSASTASHRIVNTAVVDYHTFGDPEDTGRDVDDATVLLGALPATGGEPMIGLAVLGGLLLLLGITVVATQRRRHEMAEPQE